MQKTKYFSKPQWILRYLLSAWIVISLLIITGSITIAAGPTTIEVGGFTYLTENNAYDRNPSITYDGSNYWLFYTKGDDTSTSGVRGTYNPDGDTYVVYYKTAATISGLASASETQLALSQSARPANFDQRVASATYFNGKVYVFVSSGQSGIDRGLYYYEYSGGSWSGPSTLIADATARGGHVNVTNDGSYVYIVWESSDGSSDAYTWDGATLSSKIDISSDNQPKVTLLGTTLYVVSIEDGTGDIEVHSAAAGASPGFSAHSTAIAGGGFYDPVVFNDGSDLYVISAPYDGINDSQWLIQTKYTSGSWSTAMTVSAGGYGGVYWWEYWPIGYYDGSDLYVFFTSETNSPSFSDGEIGYFKLDWDLTHDHYFYLKNAVEKALSGDTINVAAGTYEEGPQFHIDKDLTIQGVDKNTTIIKPAGNTGSSGDARGWWLVDEGILFNLSDVTLDGSGYLVYQGIRQKGGGSIDDVIFTEIKYNESGPDYSGVAVAAFGDGPVDITNSTFSEIGRVGVLYFGAGVSGSDFTGNTYTGKGDGDWLDYALDISAGAVINVEDNLIQDNRGVASSDGSTSAGILVTTYYGTGTQATITGTTLQYNTTGIAAGYDSSDTSTVVAHNNCISGNTYGVETTAPPVDAEFNWWGDASGPHNASQNPGGTGDSAADNVDFEPWITDTCGGSTTGGNWQNQTTLVYDDLQDSLDNASPGDEIRFMGGSGTFSGGALSSVNGVTINLNGGTFGPGSPFLIVNNPDTTILGPGVLDGSGTSDPGVIVNAGADNFTMRDVEVTGWQDGVQLAGSVVSFKLFGNWFHDNNDAGLQVDSGVNLTGVVTIEGNLFKENAGPGVRNDASASLDLQYNSWGDLAGPASGDGVSGTVDTSNYTFTEVFMDMDPDTEATSVNINESVSFDVRLKVDAQKLYGLTFKLTYDATKLTLNSTTFSGVWAGKCALIGTPPAGTIPYRCNLEYPQAEYDADGGTITTFNFTATGSGLSGNGPWDTYLDIDHLEANTSAAAKGGIKIFVNNAGFGAPSTTERDIMDTDDGKIHITGIAQYTGFVDLQGRTDDSGAEVAVFDVASKTLAAKYANAFSSAGGGYTTANISPHLITVGTTYYLFVDRSLYLPTTPVSASDFGHSRLLDTRPLTYLNLVYLLGGDATDDDVIDILDAGCIGGGYGLPPTTCGGSVGSSDVTGNGTVDILDLSLMGGNYTLSFSNWLP